MGHEIDRERTAKVDRKLFGKGEKKVTPEQLERAGFRQSEAERRQVEHLEQRRLARAAGLAPSECVHGYDTCPMCDGVPSVVGDFGGPVDTSLAGEKPPRTIVTPYGVHCPVHGLTCLTQTEYLAQLQAPDEEWKCPICDRLAVWDDEHHESFTDEDDFAFDEED